MSKLINMTGARVEQFTVIERAGPDRFGHAVGRCCCAACDGEKLFTTSHLRSGRVTACGRRRRSRSKALTAIAEAPR